MSFVRNARVTLYGQWARFVIQVVGFVALARLLTPFDFGVIAMVTAVIAFATLLSDFGLSLAAIQASQLTQQQKSGLFWLNVSAGTLGGLIVAASGPLLAWFYNQPILVPLSLALSAPVIVMSVSVQFRVEMNRAGRFGALAFQDVLSAFAGLAAGVVGALLGWGYWALAAQQIIQAFVLAGLAVAQARWLPTHTLRFAGTSALLRFGGNNLLAQSLSLLSRTADVLVVGRVYGAGALGTYTRATQLIALVFQQLVTPLTRVMLPKLTAQNTELSFNELLEKIQLVVAYVVVGVFSALAAVATSIIPLALGADWAETGVLLRVLCLGAIFSGLGYIYYWAMLARAQTSLLVLTELPGRVLMIVGVIAAAPLGVVAIAWTIVLGQFAIYAVTSFIVPRHGVRVVGLLLKSWRPLVVFSLATAASWVATTTERPLLVQTLVAAGAWTAVVASSLVFSSVRRDARQIARLVRS